MRIRDIDECSSNTKRYAVTSEGIQVADYSGFSALPNWQPLTRPQLTVREASDTGKHGGTVSQKLQAPIDYMVIVTARNQYPRGVYRPDRKVAGRTAVEGFVDLRRVMNNVRGYVGDKLRFIP